MKDSIHRFTTARLIAERLEPADFDDLLEFHRDARVVKWIGGVIPENELEGETRLWLQENVRHWERFGFGMWMLRDREDNFLGRAGLRHVRIEKVDEVELGYSLRSEVWGRGLATEVARPLLGIAFDRLRLPSIVAFTLPHNVRSRRVMEKLGMAFERDIVHHDRRHVLYRIANRNTAVGDSQGPSRRG